MKKNFFLSACIMIFLLSGCNTPQPQRQEVDGFTPTSVNGLKKCLINLDIQILDDMESYFYKAELYLKVYSSNNPDLQWVIPLNIDNPTSGNQRIGITSPFKLEQEFNGRLIFELLDDDSFSEAEESLIRDAVKAGGGIILKNATLYALGKGIVIDGNDTKALEKLLEDSAEVLIENWSQHQFDSYGTAEFVVCGINNIHLSNPITIIEGKSRARCNIRVYAIPIK